MHLRTDHRHRQLPAGAPSHQRRPRADGRHVRRVDHVSRTGIRERRIVAEGETTSDLAARAGAARARRRGRRRRRGRPARRSAPRAPTCLPVHRVPRPGEAGPDLPRVRRDGRVHRLHLRAPGRDRRHRVAAARAPCSSSAPTRSRAIVDFTDRATCVLFGDGAGAVVLRGRRRAGRARRRTSAPTGRAPTCSRCRRAARRARARAERVRRAASSYLKMNGQRGLQVRRARHPAGHARGARRVAG